MDCWFADLDLTKNPKDIGRDIKRGIEKNTPDLPDLSESPLDTAARQKDQVSTCFLQRQHSPA